MVADPGATTATELDAWAKELDSYPITDAFASLACARHAARGAAP